MGVAHYGSEGWGFGSLSQRNGPQTPSHGGYAPGRGASAILSNGLSDESQSETTRQSGASRYPTPLKDGTRSQRVFPPGQSLSGNERRRFPVAANTAFATAGARGGTPISPIPCGAASLGTMWTSTCGISLNRSSR